MIEIWCRTSNDAVFDWVDTHCKARLGSVGFVRLLTTVLMESVIDGVGGPTNQCKLNEAALQLREPVLKKYLDGGTTELEKQALVALQYLMHRSVTFLSNASLVSVSLIFFL